MIWEAKIMSHISQLDTRKVRVSKLIVVLVVSLMMLRVALALNIEDDFECNGFGCGTGWLGGWATSGTCEITTLSNPNDAYQMRGHETCDATRYFDGSHSSKINISFYATASSLENGDYCRYYYYDGTQYHELLALTNGDDDGTLDYYEFDVSQYGVTDYSGVRMQGGLDGADYCYIDDVTVKLDDEPITIDFVKEVGKVTNQTSLFVAGTEYEPDDEVKVFVQLIEGADPINNATCRLNIYYPNGTLWADYQAMIHQTDEKGLYYYQAYAPNVTGVYMIDVGCTYYSQNMWFYDLFGDENSPEREPIYGEFYGSVYNLNDNDGLYEEGVAETVGGTYRVEAIYNFTNYDNASIENMVLYWMGESDSDPTLTFYWWNWTNSSWSALPNHMQLSASIPSQAFAPSGIGDFMTNDIPDEAYNLNESMVRIKISASHNKQYDLWNDWLNINHNHLLNQTVNEIRGGGEIHITRHKTEIKGLVNWVIDYLQNTIYPYLQQLWGKLLGIEAQLNTTIEITNQSLILNNEINYTTHDTKNDTETIISKIDTLNQSMWQGFAEKDAHIQDAYDNITLQMSEFRANNTASFQQTWSLIEQLEENQNLTRDQMLSFLTEIDTHVNNTQQSVFEINQSIISNMNSINISLSQEIEGVQNDTTNIINLVNSLNATNTEQYNSLHSFIANLTVQVSNNYNITQQNITDLKTLLQAVNLSLSTDLDELNTSLFNVRDELYGHINTTYNALLNINQSLSAQLTAINTSIHNRIDLMETNIDANFNLTYLWLKTIDQNINGTRLELLSGLDNLSLQLNETKWQIHGHLDELNNSIQSELVLLKNDTEAILSQIGNISVEVDVNFTEVLDEIDLLSTQVESNFNITQQNITEIRTDISDLQTETQTNFIALNQSIADAEANIITNIALINNTLYNELIYTQTMLSLINTSLSNQITSLGNTIQTNFTTIFTRFDDVDSGILLNRESMTNLSLQLNETKWQIHAHLDSLNNSIQDRFDTSDATQQQIIELIGNFTTDFDTNLTQVLNEINSLSTQVEAGFNLTGQDISYLTGLVIELNSTTYQNYLDLNSSIWSVEANIRTDLSNINSSLYNEIAYTQTLLGLVNTSLHNQMTSYHNVIQDNFTQVWGYFSTMQSEHDHTQEQLFNLSLQLNETKWQIHAHLDAVNESLLNKMQITEDLTTEAIELINNLTFELNLTDQNILSFLQSMNTNITNEFNDVDSQFNITWGLIGNISDDLDANFDIIQDNFTQVWQEFDDLNASITINYNNLNQSISDFETKFDTYWVWVNNTLIQIRYEVGEINNTVSDIYNDTQWIVEWHNEWDELRLSVEAPNRCLYNTNWVVRAQVTDRFDNIMSPLDNVYCNITTDLWGEQAMTYEYLPQKWKYIHACDPNFVTFNWSVECDYYP